MRIAQVSATFPPYMGGTGNVCYHYADELAKRGHEVTVFTSRYPDCDYTYPDYFTVKRYRPLFRIGNAPFIPQLFGLDTFDIIHLHYPFYFGGEMIYLLDKIRNRSYIVSYHNNVVMQGLLKYPINIHTRVISRRILENAEKIIVPTMDFFTATVQPLLSLPKREVAEIPNGVDLTYFTRDGYMIRHEYGISSHMKVILFVGALDSAHYYKGLEVLMRSMKLAERQSQPSVLLVIGDGNLKPYYQNLARQYGIGERTIFTGTIPEPVTLACHFLASDIVVYPTVADTIESFGMVAAEGMAAGKPVIASNIPGVRCVVDHLSTGLLVKPGDERDLADAILYLLDNPAIRQEMGKNGRLKVERCYTWEKVIGRLEEEYSNVKTRRDLM